MGYGRYEDIETKNDDFGQKHQLPKASEDVGIVILITSHAPLEGVLVLNGTPHDPEHPFRFFYAFRPHCQTGFAGRQTSHRALQFLGLLGNEG